MPQLHETGYGKRLFEYEIPELNRNLSKISEMAEHLEILSIYFARIADALDKIVEKPVQKTPAAQIKDNIALLSSIKIKDIFSIRISNSLLYCRYPKHNLYQLVKSSERELLSIKNFGAKCLWEVKDYLSAKTLELGMDDNQISSNKYLNEARELFTCHSDIFERY